MEAAVDALTPEHAVEALRDEFGQVWILQYDKLLAAAVSICPCTATRDLMLCVLGAAHGEEH